MLKWLRAALLLGLSTACHDESAPPSPRRESRPVPIVTAVPSLASAAPSAPPSALSPEPARDSACKALGKKGTTELSPIPEAELQLVAAPDALYALGFTHALARVRLYRFSRAGGAVQMVGEQQGLGDRKRLAVSQGAGYYVQSGKLVRLGPGAGQSSVLHDHIHSPVAVVGDKVLGISCDAKGKVDHLLEIPAAGGEPRPLADLPRASADSCQYSEVVADERDVFVADWKGQAIFAVSRADKQVKRVVTKRGFPGPLLLESDALVYNSTSGLRRVTRDGSPLGEIASSDISYSPFSAIAANASHYFIVDNFAYSLESKLRRVPRTGGTAEVLMVLRNADPQADVISGQGFWDFAVDEQCAYVAQAQYKRSGIQILARAL